MPMTMNPELSDALSALGGGGQTTGSRTWQEIRKATAEMYPTLTKQLARPKLDERVFHATSADGNAIALHWFAPTGRRLSRAAVVHAHGGGMIAGSVALFAPYVREYVARSGVPFLSVEYRLAPEAPGDLPSQDVFAGLCWLHDHAAEFGVDPERIAVMGESAGAGLSAATAIRARDEQVPTAKQILIYPMLDDRTVKADPHVAPFLTWSAADNRVGWDAVLGDRRGTGDVSALIAPARLDDFAGLAPAFLEVGGLDLFRDETVRYASSLWAGGVDAELDVLPGLPHGWDQFAPKSRVRAAALDRRVRILQAI